MKNIFLNIENEYIKHIFNITIQDSEETKEVYNWKITTYSRIIWLIRIVKSLLYARRRTYGLRSICGFGRVVQDKHFILITHHELLWQKIIWSIRNILANTRIATMVIIIVRKLRRFSALSKWCYKLAKSSNCFSILYSSYCHVNC